MELRLGDGEMGKRWQLIRTALAMIISKPPSFSMDSFTVRTQSASMPISCPRLISLISAALGASGMKSIFIR